MGVKQGDSISATLFSIFINDLADEIKKTKVGLILNQKTENQNNPTEKDLFLNILLFADDIVPLASQETFLQFLLNIVENWCRKWRLENGD